MLTIIYYVNRCPTFKNHPIDSFLFTNFSQYFFFFEYHTLAGVMGKVINLFLTFAWNFNDIFLMCICVALSSMFRQLNVYMASFIKKVCSFVLFFFVLNSWSLFKIKIKTIFSPPQHHFGWKGVKTIACCVGWVRRWTIQ